MKEVNLNYAATSAIKPAPSIQAMVAYLNENNQNNPGRGGEGALNESRVEINARLALCSLFNIKKPEEVIFTPNVTMALNMAINGLIRQGCHVITTSMEHNAVARPLETLKNRGVIDVSYVKCGADGSLDPGDVKKHIQRNTTMLVMNHASNVTGTIQPYEECAKIAREHGLYVVLDAAQTAGYLDFDFDNSLIDVLAFTGHKGLMGPCGTGGFAVKPGAAAAMAPYITGGTGSVSHLLVQPDFLPDKFESGTPNVLGIIGLSASVEYINTLTTAVIRTHEDMLTARFLDGLQSLRRPIRIYAANSGSGKQAPVVSITADGMDAGILSSLLYERYAIVTRPGLHCAPLAHQTIGTYPEGTVRFSFGYYTTREDIDYALDALDRILGNQRN